MKPGVFLTFDVECSMGGAWQDPSLRPVPPERAVMGRYGDDAFGMPLICRTLNEFDLRATHFVEAFTDEQGFAGQTEGICRYLLDHDQDVQLHIHPNHKHYAMAQAGRAHPFTDQMADLPFAQQRDLLDEGARRIEQWTGRKPVAFRAGNMGASEETLRAMAEVGLRIDSSYTYPYLGGQCRFSDTQRYNGSKWYGQVLELALSAYDQPKLPGLRPVKPLDLVGISFSECRDGIRAICSAGADAVVILHSFSLFKVRDVQYSEGRLNRVVTKRFRRLCRWLAGSREACPAYTFADLAEAVDEGCYAARLAAPPRIVRPLRALTRKVVQLYNSAYWT